MLCGSWYLRTSPLSELYVSPLLAFRCYPCYVDPDISGPLHCRRFPSVYSWLWSIYATLWISLFLSDIVWTLISQDLSTVGALRLFTFGLALYSILLAFRYCVDPDISGHLHCRIFRHYVHLRCQSCVDPYCKDISTVGHQIPMLRGPWYVRTSPLSEIRHYVHFWCQFRAISTVDILITFLTDKTGLYIHHDFKTIHLICILDIMWPRTQCIMRPWTPKFWRLCDQELKVLHSGSSYSYLCMTQTFKIHSSLKYILKILSSLQY